jgi:DnaJ-class molecular chaperone
MDLSEILDLTLANPPHDGEDERSYNNRIASLVSKARMEARAERVKQIMRELDEQQLPLCDACEGTGYVSAMSEAPCPRCGGSGYRT